MTLPKVLLKLLSITAILLVSAGVTCAQQKGDPPTMRELAIAAFQINRTDLIARVVSSDSSMIFKEEENINGLPNFIGIDNYKSTVQLVGKEKDLQSARFTFVFTTDHDVNKLQYMRMSYFVFTIVGQTGLNWFYGPSGRFSQKPTEAISEHTRLGFLNAEFKYDPKDKAISIVFTKL